MEKKEEEKENFLITKSNDFIKSRFNYSTAEFRLFSYALKFINPHMEKEKDLPKVKIYIADFLNDSGIKNQAYYGDIEKKDCVSQMKKITHNLISKVIEITQKDGRPWQFSLVISAMYKKDDKGIFVELALNPYIKAELIGLAKHFTSYDYRNIAYCDSSYSWRMYELLKLHIFKKEPTWIVGFEDLKYLLKIDDKYKLYGHFKSRVLIISQKELKKYSDLYFEYEEISDERNRKKVAYIKFSIYKQHQERTSSQSEQEQPAPQPQNPLIKRLVDMGFNEKQAAEVVGRETPEFITANADILEDLQKQGKINTNIPAFSRGFTKDFRTQKTAFELEQEAKQEQVKQDAERIKAAKAEKAKAEEFGQKVYSEAMKTYIINFFNDYEKNAEFIKEFENYIKSPIGATIYKSMPETAKQSFLSNKIDRLELHAELIKTAGANGYILTETDGKWQAMKNFQGSLF